MSALEDPGTLAATISGRPSPFVSVRRLRIPGLALPLGLAAAYFVLVVVRLPQIITWQNADSDVASSYQLAEAIVHGHAGQVQFSTQGSWIELGWQLLTAGLPGYRLLWELQAPALGLITVAALAWAVCRVAGSRAALLAAALVAATSPDGLMNLVSAPWHNTSTLGAALLGGYLVWLDRPRGRVALAAAAGAMSVVIGVFLACDHLLAIIGLLPFLVAMLVSGSGPARRRRGLAAIAFAAVTGLVCGVVSAAVRALDLRTTTPGLWPASGHMMLVHLRWLGQGLLRLGNGLSVEQHGAVLTVLTVASAVVTIAGLASLAWATWSAIAHRRADPLRAVHTSFWCSAAVCAMVAYVVTNAAYEPSDRYFFIIVPAVACTAPLLLDRGRRARIWVAGAASVYLTAGLAAFAAGAMHTPSVLITSRATGQLSRIESVVHRHHLSIGYAGYWNAASLEWSSGERLHIAPLLASRGTLAPMFSMRVAAWYHLRPRTPSYLVLAPGDPTLPDRLPASLPAPARIVHLGRVTVDIWPYDIAAYLGPSEIAVPGVSAAILRRARHADRRSDPSAPSVTAS